jgi:broad specificity phosphatase PhoE
MRLYVIRHGETEENLNGIIQGQNPGKLTGRGIEQAKQLALRLKDESFDLIFSSDLQRAVDTAQYIASFHRTPIHFTSELRERGAGIFQGRSRDELHRAERESDLPLIDFIPELGESFRDLHIRAARFLDMLYSRFNNETILLVSHGGWNRMLLGIVMGKTIEESLTITQENTCVNIVEIDKDSGRRIHLLNCVKHL